MEIPFDILYMVASFYTKPRMKLLNWIDVNKLDWNGLSKNPNLVYNMQLLGANLRRINWGYLSRNSNAISILEANPEKINYSELSYNTNCFELNHLLEANLDNPLVVIDWLSLSFNSDPRSITLLKKYADKINWNYLSYNTNELAFNILEEHPLAVINWRNICDNNCDFAIRLLEKHPDEIIWDVLSENPCDSAIRLFEKYPDKIDWDIVSMNANENILTTLLEKYPEKMNWSYLSCNSYAIHILEKHLDNQIDWYYLSKNPKIYSTNTLLEKYVDTQLMVYIDWDIFSQFADKSTSYLLEKYPGLINWRNISYNKNMTHLINSNIENVVDLIVWAYLSENYNSNMHFFEKYPEKIKWFEFSSCPNIFEIDTKQRNIDLTKKANNIAY